MEQVTTLGADASLIERIEEDEISDQVLALFEKRLKQSTPSRLCEYLTGLPLENSDVLWLVFSDYYRVRDKYRLPHGDVTTNDPAWYEDFLRSVAERESVDIVDTTACGNFFDVNGGDAVYFPDSNRVGVRIDKEQFDDYTLSIQQLEHEIIHALQFNNTPSMPIEIKEYEAYVAGGGVHTLQHFFESVTKSIQGWYEHLSETSGVWNSPEWDSAEYFLAAVDGFALDSFSDGEMEVFEEMKREIGLLSSQPKEDGEKNARIY